MREIEGVVCTAKSKFPMEQEWLFGPRTGISVFNHQTFVSNGLVPFKNTDLANIALADLQSRIDSLDIHHTGLAKIRLVITGSDDEIDVILDQDNLIIVAGLDFGFELLGKKVNGVPGWGHMPVSNLELNGFQTFSSYQEAGNHIFGALYEVRRQGRPVSANLAVFEMERLITSGVFNSIGN